MPSFFCILPIYMKFLIFGKKKKKCASEVKCFWSYWLQNMCLFKCITGLFSENLLAVNVLTSRQNNWNLQKSTFILVFLHSEPNWVKKKLFSIISEILRLVDNTFTGNYEYSRSKRENLPLPIQINISKESSTYCIIVFNILKCTWNFECSEKKIIGEVFLKLLIVTDVLF